MPEPATISIRRAEPGDYEALRQVHAGPKVIWGTVQLPLELEVFTDNEPAIRLYQKFGFSIEGTLVRFA
ncbi:MAG: hypothetical protein NZ701_17195, partial [Roseiflexus sp.]|nr:hypothetical protein [Roseiflexus sp.]